MNIIEINNTVVELENGDTNFANCQKLASLYIIQDRYNRNIPSNNVENELNDILPQYQNYCTVKRKYQLNEVTENAVINSIYKVCDEITEFLKTLYGSTDMQEERDAIIQMIKSLNFGNED